MIFIGISEDKDKISVKEQNVSRGQLMHVNDLSIITVIMRINEHIIQSRCLDAELEP